MKEGTLRNILLCCLMGVAAQIFASYALGFILEAIPGAAGKYSSDMAPLFENEMGLIFMVVLVMPMIEEVIFRLIIFALSGRFMPFVFANLLQAALFGIYHMNLIQGIYAFLLGFLLGMLKNRTGKLLSCIGFHCFFNAAGLLIDDFVPADIPAAFKAVFMSAALAACIFIYLKITSNRCDGQTA